MKRNRTDRFPAFSAFVCFLMTGILRVCVPVESIFHNFVFILSILVYFSIIFYWGIYLERSILSKKIRRLLLAVVYLMAFYILIGVARHRIFLDGNYVARFLWYLYYLPQIVATYLSFIIALRVSKPEAYKIPKFLKIVFVTGLTIVAVYLTNDIHQLAFRFNLDFVAWDQQYSWGPLFYVSTLWIYLWLIAGVVMLSIKCVSVNKKKAWIPVFWLLLGSVYLLCVYIFDFWSVDPFNLPETHCFIVIAMFESSIRIGIMPSNRDYGEIVSKSSAAFQIADYRNKVIYCSDNAVKLTAEQINQAKNHEVYIDKNNLLLSHPVSGGYVYWTEDMTEVRETNEKLSQISQSLSEEGELLRAENEMREQRAKIAQQTKLYDEISELVRPQLVKIDGLIDAQGDFKKNMAQICILNCYVKRRANLELLRNKKRLFSSQELYLSIKESAEYINLYGGAAFVEAERHCAVKSEILLCCFDLWQSIVEELLPDFIAISGIIKFENDEMRFRVNTEMKNNPEFPKEIIDRINGLSGKLKIQNEDGTVYVSLSFGKGVQGYD